MIGGDVRGVDRNKAAEAPRDREVERTKTGRRGDRPDIEPLGRPGARAMILRRVNLLKVKGITAMFCILTHGDAERATTHANISSLEDCERSVSDSKGSGLIRHALPAWPASSRGAAGGVSDPQHWMSFNLESKQHEQKNRGFARL